MGLLSFIGVNSAPKPVTTSASSSVSSPAAPETQAAPKQVAVNDTFEPAPEAPMCSLDGTGADACFPAWGDDGSGIGVKAGGGSVEG